MAIAVHRTLNLKDVAWVQLVALAALHAGEASGLALLSCGCWLMLPSFANSRIVRPDIWLLLPLIV